MSSDDCWLERQRQIQSLHKQEEQLNSAKQTLEQEQTEVKGQLEFLQRSFNASRSVGQEIRSKVSLLHLHLSKLGISDVIWSSHMMYKW